jgi:tRNA(adenine34) deaminase
MGMNDHYFMKEAFLLAQMARKQGEVPVGAVLVDASGEIIGRGFNQVIENNDPTLHAEIQAVRDAAKLKKNHRLLNTTLYVTLEPCSMCAGALVHARIKRLVYATRDFKAGAAGSIYNLMDGTLLNHRIILDEGPMQHECSTLLSDFFKELRQDL